MISEGSILDTFDDIRVTSSLSEINDLTIFKNSKLISFL